LPSSTSRSFNSFAAISVTAIISNSYIFFYLRNYLKLRSTSSLVNSGLL
jgi:hypothetical protein